MVVAVVRWYVQTKENEMRRVYMMVDRILGELLDRQAQYSMYMYIVYYCTCINNRYLYSTSVVLVNQK